MALNYSPLNPTPQPLSNNNPTLSALGKLGSGIINGIGSAASGLYSGLKSAASLGAYGTQKQVQYQPNGNAVFTPTPLNYSPAPKYTPAPVANNTSATSTSSTNVPSPYQEYTGRLAANQVNIGTTENPNIQTNGTSTPSTNSNGLTNAQVAQGYSTIQGNFNPLTGQPNTPAGGTNTTPLSSSPTPLQTSNSNTQQVDTNGQQIGTNATTTGANTAFQQYLQSLQSDQKTLADFNNKQKVTQAQLGAQPILSSFATGQQAVQQAAAQAEQQNLTQQVTNDQTGITNILGEQGIGVQQQQNANTLALGLKPTVAAYGQTVFNPATGTFSGGGNISLSGAPANDISTLSSAVANGSIDYQTAYSQLSSAYGGAVANQLLSSIQKTNPNFNVNTSIGQGSAAQSNASTTGSVSATANAQGYTNALQTYNNLNTAANAANDQAGSVSQILAQSGLNNAGSNDYTTAINNLAGRLGSTNVTALDTAIAELQNRYSTLLASNGTTPSGAQTQALQLLNPNSSAAQINQAISVLQNSAGILVGNQYKQLQGYQQQLNGGGTSNSTTSSGGVNYSF